MTVELWVEIAGMAVVGLLLLLVLLRLLRLVDQRLTTRLEQFSAERQKELEALKAEQQQQLAQMRRQLSSRFNRFHEREFRVLPKAWVLLHEFHGQAVIALDLPLQPSLSHVRSFSDSEFDEFIAKNLIGSLSETQKAELVTLSNEGKADYLKGVRIGVDLAKTDAARARFSDYLIRNRIFIPQDLREKFAAVHERIADALSEYEADRDTGNRQLQPSGRNLLGGELQAMVDDIESAIRERLRDPDDAWREDGPAVSLTAQLVSSTALVLERSRGRGHRWI
jgi:hypothetical protein